MDVKAAGLIVGLLIIIGGVFMISINQNSGGAGLEPNEGMTDIDREHRPYFWPGVIVVVSGLIVTVISYMREES